MKITLSRFIQWQLLLNILNKKSEDGYQLIENKKNTYLFELDDKQYFYFMACQNTCIADDILQKAEIVDWNFYHTLSWKLIPKHNRMHLYRIDKNICDPKQSTWDDIQKKQARARVYLYFYYIQIPWFIITCIFLNLLIKTYNINVPPIVQALITFGIIMLLSDVIMKIMDTWQNKHYRKYM